MSGRTIANVLLASSGLLVVVVMVAVGLRPDNSSTQHNAELIAGLRELRRTQERTVEVLARLERLVGQRLDAPVSDDRTTSPPGDTGRRAVIETPLPENFVELIESLDSLRRTFEKESSETRELLRETPGLNPESLVALRERRQDTDWPALDELESLWRADAQVADRSQYFQTPRDLLEAYGPPTAIYRPKGGMLFYYRRSPEGVLGPSWYFRIQDGIVVEFFVEDETGDEE